MVWVETDAPCTVSVLGCEARTFCVEDHHYALVRCEGLEPGTITPYEVELDGAQVWPLPDSPYPPSVVRTHDADRPTRIVFGSCRVCLVEIEGRPGTSRRTRCARTSTPRAARSTRCVPWCTACATRSRPNGRRR